MKKLVVLQLTAFIALFALSTFAHTGSVTHSPATSVSTPHQEHTS